MQLTQGKHAKEINFQVIARYFRFRKSCYLQKVYLSLMPHYVKGLWTPEEDLKVLIAFRVYGRNWAKIRDLGVVFRSSLQIRERVHFSLSNQFASGIWPSEDDPLLR